MCCSRRRAPAWSQRSTAVRGERCARWSSSCRRPSATGNRPTTIIRSSRLLPDPGRWTSTERPFAICWSSRVCGRPPPPAVFQCALAERVLPLDLRYRYQFRSAWSRPRSGPRRTNGRLRTRVVGAVSPHRWTGLPVPGARVEDRSRRCAAGQGRGVRRESTRPVSSAPISTSWIQSAAPRSCGTSAAQDVAAIGELFATGKLPVERVVSLAGPLVQQPRLLATRLGAATVPLVEGQLFPGDTRVISGSALYGHRAMSEAGGFLGRYSTQISCLAEDHRRRFLGWLSPGGASFQPLAPTPPP